MKRRKGFTLLEAILSIGMISLAMAVIFMAFYVGLNIFLAEMSSSEVYLECNKGIESIAKRLRGATEILNSGAQNISFYMPLAEGGATREAVAYSWNGTPGDPLLISVDGDVRTLSNNVHDFELAYDNPSDIKMVTIRLMVSIDEETSTLESSVRLRNL